MGLRFNTGAFMMWSSFSPKCMAAKERTSKTYGKSFNPHSNPKQRKAMIERLESRQMLAADLVATYFDVSGGPLLHTGDLQGAAVTVKNLNVIWFLDDAGPFVVRVFISDDPTITTSDTPLVN